MDFAKLIDEVVKEVEQSKEENGSKSKKQIYEVIRRCDKNEYVAMDVLVRICMALGCGMDDIVEIERE